MSNEMNGVIFKISFSHPDFKLNNSKISDNKDHLKYIANRPGVDKTITETDLESYFDNELEKGLTDAEHLNYISDISTDDTYLNYIGKRMGSTGLFGADGIEDIKEVEKQMDNAKNFIYRGIVSIREEDAIRLNYMDKEKWQDMIRKTAGEMSKEIGISRTNLKWVAAYHEKAGNPHIHFMLWETNKIEKISPYISKPKLRNIKKIFTDEIFEEERLQVLLEKDAMRDLIKELANNDISQVVRIEKEIEDIQTDFNKTIDKNRIDKTPDLYNDDFKYLSNKIKELSNILPKQGRINYAFMPENLKKEIDDITNFLLEKPDFQKTLNNNLGAVEKLTRYYSGKNEDIEKAKQNAIDDIYKRIGNIILKGAKSLDQSNNFIVDKDKAYRALEFIKTIENKIDTSKEDKELLSNIASSLNKCLIEEENIYNILKNYIASNNIKIDDIVLNNIITETNEARINSPLTSKEINKTLNILKETGFNEKESYKIIKKVADNFSNEVNEKLKNLKELGLLKKNYELTNAGIDEFLKYKTFNKLERSIIKVLNSNRDKEVNLTDLLRDKSIFHNLKDYKMNDFYLNKNDTNIRTLFGKNNLVTLEEIEKNIIEKHTNEDKLLDFKKAENEIDIVTRRIEMLVKNDCVNYNKETNQYYFNNRTNDYFEYNEDKQKYLYTKEAVNELNINLKEYDFGRYDIEVTFKYIENSSGILGKEDLKKLIYAEFPSDKEKAEKQYEYMIKRLDSLKRQKYIDKIDDKYMISQKGYNEKEKFDNPQKFELIDNINYLKRLGLIEITENNNYILTEKYDKLIENSLNKENETELQEINIDKDIVKIIDYYKNDVDIENIKLYNNRNIINSYLKDEFNKSDEEITLKKLYNIKDITSKTINTLSKILLTANTSPEETKNIINEWNIKSDSKLNVEDINKIVDDVYKNIEENKAFDMVNIVSKKDWQEVFENFNIENKDIPEWIYKSKFSPSLINDLLKNVWNNIEKQRLHSEDQAYRMMKNLTKQETIQNSKAARKEQYIKNKDSNNKEIEDEYEI